MMLHMKGWLIMLCPNKSIWVWYMFYSSSCSSCHCANWQNTSHHHTNMSSSTNTAESANQGKFPHHDFVSEEEYFESVVGPGGRQQGTSRPTFWPQQDSEPKPDGLSLIDLEKHRQAQQWAMQFTWKTHWRTHTDVMQSLQKKWEKTAKPIWWDTGLGQACDWTECKVTSHRLWQETLYPQSPRHHQVLLASSSLYQHWQTLTDNRLTMPDFRQPFHGFRSPFPGIRSCRYLVVSRASYVYKQGLESASQLILFTLHPLHTSSSSSTLHHSQ